MEVIPTGAFNSRTSFLHLRYTPDAPFNAPSRLVLKRNTLETWSIAAGADEVRFYRLIAQLRDHPQVIPPCYAAEYNPTTGDSFLLLQDLSETHKPPITRDEQLSIVNGVPLAAYQESVIDLLAGFHAYWWDHRRLLEGEFEVGFWSRDIDRFNQYLARRSAAWQRIVAKYGERLPQETHAFYERLFNGLPGFFSSVLEPRFKNPHNLTLTHGDAYFCNFLCPVIPGSAPTYLMDWQSPGCDLAAYDLVNLLAAFWMRDQRRAENREINLLRRYHQGLLSNGVQNYTWEDLAADYRAGLIFWVLMPVQDGGDGADWSYWWPKMQCLVAAFEDWGCEELEDMKA
ncbi:MAG TPA: phosphotransferase [Anaerolineales bacterium]